MSCMNKYIADADFSDTGSSEIHGCRCSESACTDDQNASVQKLFLALYTDFF